MKKLKPNTLIEALDALIVFASGYKKPVGSYFTSPWAEIWGKKPEGTSALMRATENGGKVVRSFASKEEAEIVADNLNNYGQLRLAVEHLLPIVRDDGWTLGMAVLQSDLYAKLSDEERAVCDALVRTNPYLATKERIES